MATADSLPLAIRNAPSLPGACRGYPRPERALRPLQRTVGALARVRRDQAGRTKPHSCATAGAAPFNRPYPERS